MKVRSEFIFCARVLKASHNPRTESMWRKDDFQPSAVVIGTGAPTLLLLTEWNAFTVLVNLFKMICL